MMGDQGTSDTTLLRSPFELQRRDEFQGQAPPMFVGGTSVPSFPGYLHSQALPFLQPLDVHLPAVSYRQDAHEEWSNRAFHQPPSGPLTIGPSDWSEAQIRGPSCQLSADTSDLMTAGGRVGADVVLTFPEGEEDAVTITRSDLAGIQPTEFLSDNIIDFYIKYLKATLLSAEHLKRFHFFNSFFFTKLLENTASTAIDECKVDYEQLRKWTGEVNLFEKDYVFIPVIKSSHWSLIVVCHLRSLNPSSADAKKGSPCMLHLDPIAGQHESFEGQVRSYILQAWMERFQALDNLDQLHSLFQMRYVQAKVSKQDNDYDCGLYVLHYIEVFLSTETSPQFSFSSIEPGAHFSSLDFKTKVLEKRIRIEHLIFELGGLSQEQVEKYLDIQSKPQEVGRKRKHLPKPPKPPKESKSKKWNAKETLTLLQCMVKGNFYKGKQGAMNWDGICEQINEKNNGPTRSKEQCQNRFDTLLKAYKDLNAYCERERKEFSKVTEKEKLALKLATPIEKNNEEWYNHLGKIYHERLHLKAKLNPLLDIGIGRSPHNSSPRSPMALSPLGSCELKEPSPKQVATLESVCSRDEVRICNDMLPIWLSALNEELRSTLLNLVQDCKWAYIGKFNLEVVCRRLAIVQDCEPREICEYVLKLGDLNLVDVLKIDPEEANGESHLYIQNKKELSLDPEMSKKIQEEVLDKYPYFKTYHHRFTIEQSSFQHIRVLSMSCCYELQHLDLKSFPELRILEFKSCSKLKLVTGWEYATSLGWLEIRDCHSYADFPNLECLLSLREFCMEGNNKKRLVTIGMLHFSQCIQLRRLEILGDWGRCLSESMDMKALVSLEVVSFRGQSGLSTIEGFSKLHALTKLDLGCCKNLSTIKGLSKLHALTELNLQSCKNLSTIKGLSKLHALTELNLQSCKNLSTIKGLSTLHALTKLNLHGCMNLPTIESLNGLYALIELHLGWCNNLSSIKGMSGLHALTELHLGGNENLLTIKDLRKLHSLTKLVLYSSVNQSTMEGLNTLHTLIEIVFSRCVNLWTMEYLCGLHALTKLHLELCNNLSTIKGLSGLHALTNMHLECCDNLSSIESLGGLHALTELHVLDCKNLSNIEDLSGLYALTNLSLVGCMMLRRVPDLGYLKALNYLDLSGTDVEAILGLEELQLLTKLLLYRCISLKRLPFLGHLKALTHLDLSHSGVEEIPGIEHLINLETLYCVGIELEWLPCSDDLPKLNVYTSY